MATAHRLSTAQAKHATTIVWGKRDAPFSAIEGPSIARSAPSGPASSTIIELCSGVAPRSTAQRRDRRAIPTAAMPAITGPASQITPRARNGAMKSGQPGVYWENLRPSTMEDPEVVEHRQAGGNRPISAEAREHVGLIRVGDFVAVVDESVENPIAQNGRSRRS